VSELASTIREALAALAAADRGLKRFGAARHRYQLAPPGPDDTVIEDLRVFVTTIGASGAGPGYGFLGIREPVTAAGVPWTSALPIAHLGCGYAAVVALGPHALAGSVWLDARAVGVVKPLAGTFTAFYVDWVDRLANNRWPDDPVTPGMCPLPNALGGYLGVHEQRLGIEPGTLDGPELRAALVQLGSHSIEIAAERSVLFADGSRVDPCIACARLVENLGSEGLVPDVVAPGAAP
jgi:hypothetical protein